MQRFARPDKPAAWTLCTMAALAFWVWTGEARAEADGPDYFRVIRVSAGDVLNIRAEPVPWGRKVGEIPPHGTCVRNLGCRGGLTYKEFTTLKPAARAARERANPRWCKVEYRGTTGWVAGVYLAEGDCPEGGR